ncbi:MAG: DUF86 domain-containing protein [Pseudonocardiales bacterium]|nr:DUF86 domain-containing protein [Pseudonocardiales bacterium]
MQRRLELLREYLGELDRLSRLAVSDYLQDHAYTGRYLVQVAAQSCIDLANHLASSEGWRAPKDLGDSFTVLAEHEVIDGELAGRLRGLAGMRNRLVHVYADIDDERVHDALVDGLADLDAFGTAVARFASPP